MPLSNRRRARRKEIQLQETSDVEDVPDSSPSRPASKKRKVALPQHSTGIGDINISRSNAHHLESSPNPPKPTRPPKTTTKTKQTSPPTKTSSTW